MCKRQEYPFLQAVIPLADFLVTEGLAATKEMDGMLVDGDSVSGAVYVSYCIASALLCDEKALSAWQMQALT